MTTYGNDDAFNVMTASTVKYFQFSLTFFDGEVLDGDRDLFFVSGSSFDFISSPNNFFSHLFFGFWACKENLERKKVTDAVGVSSGGGQGESFSPHSPPPNTHRERGKGGREGERDGGGGGELLFG